MFDLRFQQVYFSVFAQRIQTDSQTRIPNHSWGEWNENNLKNKKTVFVKHTNKTNMNQACHNNTYPAITAINIWQKSMVQYLKKQVFLLPAKIFLMEGLLTTNCCSPSTYILKSWALWLTNVCAMHGTAASFKPSSLNTIDICTNRQRN